MDDKRNGESNTAHRGKGCELDEKIPPVEVIEFSERGKTTTDEDNKTLEMMQKYGIENVRGGIWCELQFEDRVLRNLKGQVAHYSPDKGSEKRRKPKRSKHFADPEISAKRVESIEKLKKRGVFYVGKNRKYKGVKRCYSKIKEDFEKGNKWATKWYPILSSLKSKGNKSSFGLGPLYQLITGCMNRRSSTRNCQGIRRGRVSLE